MLIASDADLGQRVGMGLAIEDLIIQQLMHWYEEILCCGRNAWL